MLRVPLVTLLAREMRLKFLEVDQRLEMLRVALVTILALEMRLNFFQVDQALEMLRVPLVTILAREMRLKDFWSRPSFGDVASTASHDIGGRNAIENFLSRPSFGDVASAAGHDSPWAKSEKVTVWSHDREQRFDTSNLFFNLWKTVMAWWYWAEACKTWRKWAKSVLPMVAMATGHRFSRNPPFNASKGCVKWSKWINYSWETLDFAGLQKKSGNSLSEDQVF